MKILTPPFEKMSAKEIDNLVRLKWLAYNDLQLSIQILFFQEKTIHWLEKVLLKWVRQISKNRIKQLAPGILTPDLNEDDQKLRKISEEARAEAEAGNHKLSSWVSGHEGWRANCQVCGRTTWLGLDGLRFSWLDELCTGRKPSWKEFARDRLTQR